MGSSRVATGLLLLVAMVALASCTRSKAPRLDKKRLEYRLLKRHQLLQPEVHPFFWKRKDEKGLAAGLAAFKARVRKLSDDIAARGGAKAGTMKVVAEHATSFVKAWELLRRAFRRVCTEDNRSSDCVALGASIRDTMLSLANFYNMRQLTTTRFLEQQCGLSLPRPQP